MILMHMQQNGSFFVFYFISLNSLVKYSHPLRLRCRVQKWPLTEDSLSKFWYRCMGGWDRVCGRNPISSYWVPIASREKARNKRRSCP